MEIKPTKPVLKWAGGKRQLIEQLVQALPPSRYERYIEPFIGGGALLFELQPKRAIINDYNEEIINLYEVIRDDADGLIRILTEYKEKHNKDFFYEIRALDRENGYTEHPAVERAARTLYLNRTCYNGLFRVSRKGYFNTPIGRYKNPQIVDEENIYAVQEYLQKAKVEIHTGDFEKVAMLATEGDFVYLDPPYHPLSKTSSFSDYTSAGFGVNEQERLKTVCERLDKKGVYFLQSNSDCEYIRALYEGFHFKTVEVRRAINSNSNNRSNITEVLISNYELHGESK